MPRVTVLAGGVGAARFLSGLVRVVPPEDITAVVNVGDDTIMHGLHISPDLDTVTYTLAGAINAETGWGLSGETWNAMEGLERYGGPTWFGLGDRDLATHLYRTGCLTEGATLSEVTSSIAKTWDVKVHLVPVTDDRVATMVTITDEDGKEREVGFQDYFVRRHHGVPISAVRFAGADRSAPAPGVLDAIESAAVVVIAPSNPIVSIAPVLAVPGVREAIVSAQSRVVAVSPIVAGAALKGPADRMLRELGHESSVVGVARLYRDLASALVIDEADRDVAAGVEAEGVRPIVTATVMATPSLAESLARRTLESVG